MTDSHETDAPETPSQGIFIGWLALALMGLAILAAIVAISAGASHGFQ